MSPFEIASNKRGVIASPQRDQVSSPPFHSLLKPQTQRNLKREMLPKTSLKSF